MAAQRFDGNGQFLFGHFFLVTSSRLCGYTVCGGFGSQRICKDLKLSVGNLPNQQCAAQLDLADVYTQALLYVPSHEGTSANYIPPAPAV